jgi:ubiquinone/menaquinone biosynthesis C-methylase UbiE
MKEMRFMDKPESNLDFSIMSFCFKIRDIIRPPQQTLGEVDIKPGYHVLDYGCGPGGFSIAAAELIGQAGKVYALDIHPLSPKYVSKAALRKRLTNVETICAASPAELESEKMDIVLLYDTFHDLSDQDGALRDLHRVMKPKSILSLTDHHMKKNDTIAAITAGGLLRFVGEGERTLSFAPNKPEPGA